MRPYLGQFLSLEQIIKSWAVSTKRISTGSVFKDWIRILFCSTDPAEPTRNNVTLTENCSDGSNLISGKFFSLDDETLEACT